MESLKKVFQPKKFPILFKIYRKNIYTKSCNQVCRLKIYIKISQRDIYSQFVFHKEEIITKYLFDNLVDLWWIYSYVNYNNTFIIKHVTKSAMRVITFAMDSKLYRDFPGYALLCTLNLKY